MGFPADGRRVAVELVMPAVSSWGQVPVYRRRHRADPFPVQRRLPVGPEGEREEEGWDKGGRYREVGGGAQDADTNCTTTIWSLAICSLVFGKQFPVHLYLFVVAIDYTRLVNPKKNRYLVIES